MKVGLLYARTGPAGIWAASLDAAALLACAEINANGGVRGRSIEIATQDCGSTVGAALDAVDTLIQVDGVDAIVGAHASNVRDAVSHRADGRAAYVYTAQYEGVVCGPSTVAIGSTDQELIGPALSWLKDVKRADRFFFVGDDYIWPRVARQYAFDAARRQGGQWLGEAFLPIGRRDESEALRALARSGAQVAILALLGQSAIDFNRAFAAAGLDEKILRLGLIVDETVMCGIGAEASVNLFTAAHYFAGCQSRGANEFLERYHDAFGEWAPPVSASSAHYYQGLHFVAALARNLGTARGCDLARHLNRPLSRRTARAMLDEKPIGGASAVRIAAADGVSLRVVAEYAAS